MEVLGIFDCGANERLKKALLGKRKI